MTSNSQISETVIDSVSSGSLSDNVSSSGVLSSQVDEIISSVSGSSMVTSTETFAMSGTVEHPIMSTPLDDYTVTEGLLLGIFIAIIAAAVFKFFKLM
ncbi:MAG: hypothetical protein RR145_05025 [Oscillospiraceae bacterium]